MPFTGLFVKRFAYTEYSTVIGLRAGDIPPDDRRLHAARAVGLHPGLLREKETVQALPEVFDHVVALVFAMNQHIQPDLFLQGDAVRRSYPE